MTNVAAGQWPDCVNALSDTDGDGFGWEHGLSCVVSSSSRSIIPVCVGTNDPDGDGFGWENSASCVIAEGSGSRRKPICAGTTDPDGDGFGWESGASCVIAEGSGSRSKPICAGTTDPDGDGFGWESGASCVIAEGSGSRSKPVCAGTSDPDGDGFGWENGASCVVGSGGNSKTTKPECVGQTDPDGDGFGWEYGKSCVIGARNAPMPDETVFIKFPACSQEKYDPEGDGFGWENSRTCSSWSVGDGGRSITDIVLVTGQSNALGAETATLDPDPFDEVLDSPVRRVYAYSNTGWGIASLRQIWDHRWLPRGHIDRLPANNFAFHFAKEVVRTDAERVVGFILITAPGQNIAHWDRDGAFFSAIGRKVRQALAALPNKQARVSAILWHQGESDYADSYYYTEKLKALVANFRQESWFDNQGLFICGETLNSPVNRRLLALNNDGDSRTGCVSSNGLNSVGDDTHFTANSLRTLGKRYAGKYMDLVRP